MKKKKNKRKVLEVVPQLLADSDDGERRKSLLFKIGETIM